jgi:hypothetical protein
MAMSSIAHSLRSSQSLSVFAPHLLPLRVHGSTVLENLKKEVERSTREGQDLESVILEDEVDSMLNNLSDQVSCEATDSILALPPDPLQEESEDATSTPYADTQYEDETEALVVDLVSESTSTTSEEQNTTTEPSMPQSPPSVDEADPVTDSAPTDQNAEAISASEITEPSGGMNASLDPVGTAGTDSNHASTDNTGDDFTPVDDDPNLGALPLLSEAAPQSERNLTEREAVGSDESTVLATKPHLEPEIQLEQSEAKTSASDAAAHPMTPDESLPSTYPNDTVPPMGVLSTPHADEASSEDPLPKNVTSGNDTLAGPQIDPTPPDGQDVVSLPSSSSLLSRLKACVDQLKFPEFQAKMKAKLAAGSQLNQSTALTAAELNQDVFRLLLKKISSLEQNSKIVELYIIQVICICLSILLFLTLHLFQLSDCQTLLSKELDNVLAQDALEAENATSRQAELNQMMESLLAMIPQGVMVDLHQPADVEGEVEEEENISPQVLRPPHPSSEVNYSQHLVPPLSEGGLLDCFLFSLPSPSTEAAVNTNLCLRLGVTLALLSLIASILTCLLVAIVLLSRRSPSRL